MPGNHRLQGPVRRLAARIPEPADHHFFIAQRGTDELPGYFGSQWREPGHVNIPEEAGSRSLSLLVFVQEGPAYAGEINSITILPKQRAPIRCARNDTSPYCMLDSEISILCNCD